MFHCIDDNMSEAADKEYSISVTGFKQLIGQLLDYRFQFCDVEDFAVGSRRSKILLTFDDAYSGVYTRLYEFLKNREIPFVVFQACDFLDKEGYLSTTMIKDMLQYDKFILGAHTISHCNLHEDKDYEKEIRESINFLREKFGIVPKVFAYPYGAFVTIDIRNVRIVRECYQYAFSTCGTYCTRLNGIKKYLIPRININESNYKMFLEKVKK